MQQPDSSLSPYLRNVSLTLDAEPRDTDVLCGSKSKATGQHPGNDLLRQKIEASIDAYDATTTLQERITLNRSIVTFMRHTYGSRFVKQVPGGGGWTLAEDQAIRDKVSHALRFASQQRKRQLLQQQQKLQQQPQQHQQQQQQQQPYHDQDNRVVTDVNETAAVPSAFARQQEILQGIMQPTLAVSTATHASPAVVSMESFMASSNNNDVDMAMEMEPVMTTADDICNYDYNNNNNDDQIMMEFSQQELTTEDHETLRGSSILPNMAAQVSSENLDYADASPEHHRVSAVAFANVLQSLQQRQSLRQQPQQQQF